MTSERRLLFCHQYSSVVAKVHWEGEGGSPAHAGEPGVSKKILEFVRIGGEIVESSVTIIRIHHHFPAVGDDPRASPDFDDHMIPYARSLAQENR